MTQTLTSPIGTPSLTFLNNRHPPPFTPAGKLHFRRRNSCNALIHSTEVDSRRCSLYEVLRVKRDATANEIKAAYRNLAKVYHPDCCEHDGGKFVEIRDAYATLYDPVDRAMYDIKLNMGLRRRSGTYGGYTSRRWETDQCW